VDELSGRRMQSNLKAFERLFSAIAICNDGPTEVCQGLEGSHLSLLENVLTQSSP